MLRMLVAICLFASTTLPLAGAEPTISTAPATDAPALGGSCPVTLKETGEIKPGKPAFQVVFDYRVYHMADAESKQQFEANPSVYAPAFAGGCVVAKVREGRRTPGKPEHACVHEDRLYVFSTETALVEFLDKPSRFVEADIAYQEYCPVCLLDLEQLMAGKPQYTVVHDGLTYSFPTERQMRTFEANPARYAPALGGDCVVTFGESGKRIGGTLTHGAFFEGRVYLLGSEDARKKFIANPTRYADLDIALDGKCPVTNKLLSKATDGLRDSVSVFEGFRYFTAGAQEKTFFEANPWRFAERKSSPSAPAAN